ncbi:MAG TPA: phage baseplate assembly protein V [Verrucomicrobiae bacterium]|jgi:phage baseplate assembly protein gpV
MEPLHTLMSPQTQQARKRLVHGLVSAKVRSRESDGTYRLDYLTMGDDEASAPARVMMPMAGGNRGTYFFPEPGDEVIVSFELGDTNLPVILGAVWNQNDQPPSQADTSSDNNVRTIVSRSGHELTFDDSPGAEKITLKSQGGRVITLDDTAPGQVSVSTATGVQITLSDADGSLTLSAPLQINLQSTLINLQASVITLLTTGTPPGSMVVIDNVPFGLHMHTPAAIPPLGSTGPVAPA